MDTNTETHYIVKGMKCDGCIANAKKALSGVEGYEDAEFNLSAGMAIIKGEVQPQDVIKALTDAGYPAEQKQL